MKDHVGQDWDAAEVRAMLDALNKEWEKAEREPVPADLPLPERLQRLRVNGSRPEGMLFFGFLSNLAIGMTAVRRSWPKEWCAMGLWMDENGTLILNDQPWQPTQQDLLADDWEIGD